MISSLVTLLPLPLWLLISPLLPEELIPLNNLTALQPGFVVLPLVMLGVHLICLFLTDRFGGGREQSKKVVGMMFWIIPALSLYTSAMLAAILFGLTDSPLALVMVLLGVLLTVIGNYLPKTTRNVTVGIKIRWALASDDNWRATHRLGGRLFVISGFGSLLSAFLPTLPAIIIPTVLLAVAVVAPIVYSYSFYKKQLADGSLTEEEYKDELSRIFKGKRSHAIVGLAVTAALLAFLPFLLFTGDVTVTLSDTSLSVDADFWIETTLKYEDIDAAEYREEGVGGERINGIGSPRLLAGIFRNAEFGPYTRYTYAKGGPCIVLTANGTKIVFAADTPEQTAEIYNQLLTHLG